MKRTFKYALAAILTAALVSPALAAGTSDNFPDVPDNHWAFEALARLKKDGLLVGYPDGLYRGNRPASRYELAVAIHACYTNLKSVTDGLDSQIKALSDKLNGLATTADVQNLRDALTALQNDVNGMKGYGEDIANLKKLANTFEKELASLGVDVEALKKDLSDLADRVTRLEKKKPAVAISGDVNLLMLAGNSRNDNPGLDMDGHLNGVSATKSPVGLTDDLTMLQEGAFTFAGTNDTGPKWKGTLVVGNMLDTFGSQSTFKYGPNGGYAEANSDIYLQDFSVKFDSSVAGLGFNAELGRVAYKVSPYMFQRIDNTSYFSNDRWDDGKYRFDGGILGFNFGSTKIDVFAGDNDNVTSINGFGINPLQSGVYSGAFSGNPNLVIDRTLGVNLNTPLTSNGNLNLAYLWLASESEILLNATAPANRLAVYGGDLNFTFGKVAISGGYSKSDVEQNTTNVNNQDDAAWYAKIGLSGKRWGLNAGYREVEANYLAPGDWGRLGVQRNPTNIEGWVGDAHIDFSKKLVLSATGEFDKGVSDNYPGSGFNTGTTINKYTVGLAYQVNPNLSLNVGYEDDEFLSLDPSVVTTSLNGDASYKWTTFGIGYGLSDTSKLLIQYQVSDVSNEYQITPGGGGRYTGGLLSTQLTIKF